MKLIKFNFVEHEKLKSTDRNDVSYGKYVLFGQQNQQHQIYRNSQEKEYILHEHIDSG